MTDKKPVFVFGSNLAGRHGKGAALHARTVCGAIYGQGIGRQGNSYAIPTKDGRNGANLRLPSQTLPLPIIQKHVDDFLFYAASRPEETFEVTPIGCGHAGYTPDQIAPFFRSRTPNVLLPPEFVRAIGVLD